MGRPSGTTCWSGTKPETSGPCGRCGQDPHHPPQSVQPDHAVIYASPSPITAVAEEVPEVPHHRPLHRSPVPLRVVGNTAVDPPGPAGRLADQQPRDPRRCRWDRGTFAGLGVTAILDTWPELDGLLTRSTMDGRDTCVTSFLRRAPRCRQTSPRATADRPGRLLLPRSVGRRDQLRHCRRTLATCLGDCQNGLAAAPAPTSR